MMNLLTTSMAAQVADAAIAFQLHRTGHAPTAATVVMAGDTLVITLHGALSEAERVLSRTAEGAAKVQVFHRELFGVSADVLRREIERITGMTVREAAGEVEPVTGAVVHAFTSGTMVQVFQMMKNSAEPAKGAGIGRR
jgi:uncharacterized protein YbcI